MKSKRAQIQRKAVAFYHRGQIFQNDECVGSYSFGFCKDSNGIIKNIGISIIYDDKQTGRVVDYASS